MLWPPRCRRTSSRVSCLNVSSSLFVSLSLSFSLPPSLCLSLSLAPSLPPLLPPFLSVCLPPSLSLPPPPGLAFPLPLARARSVWLSPSFSFSVSLLRVEIHVQGGSLSLCGCIQHGKGRPGLSGGGRMRCAGRCGARPGGGFRYTNLNPQTQTQACRCGARPGSGFRCLCGEHQGMPRTVGRRR